MENEDLNLDLDKIEGETESKLKVKDRFAKLSEKVTLSNREKEEATKAREKAEADAQNLSRERDFYKDFSANSAKYPNANQFQEKIWDKVKKGYSTEDAMVAVLNAEGKLNAQTNQTSMQPITQTHNGQVAGGSSPTNIPDKDKSIENMTLAEKLAELKEAEKRGDISLS